MAKNNENIRVLERSKYIPVHLVATANHYLRGASKIYRRLFGLGIIEWRILSMSLIGGQVSANDICNAINLDKASASRSVQKLKSLGYIKLFSDVNDKRKNLVSLTPLGIEIHDKILDVALAREEDFMAGFTTQEKKTLIKLLNKMDANFLNIDETKYDHLVNK